MITVALSSWSLHTLFLNQATTGLRGIDFPRVARQYFGVRNIEYFEGDYAPDLMEPGFDDAKHAELYRRECQAHGIRVVCLAAINDFTHDNPDLRARDRDRVLRLARHCRVLGCPVIRINSGRRPLDPARAGRLVEEMSRLADELEGQDLCLAMENHPQILDSECSTSLMLEAIELINRDNVRLCPDLGAIGPGYWEAGFLRLAPWASHVHLKPEVLDASDGSPTARFPIEKYGPRVREILEGVGYQGAVSFESLPFLHLKDDPYEATLSGLCDVARVFGQPLEPSSYPPPPKRTPTGTPNEDPDLAPSERILELLADGCERRLDAHIRICDIATGKVVVSQSAAHRHPSGPPLGLENTHFCALVDREPSAAHQCEQFYEDKFNLLQKGEVDQPWACICPMGLIVLTVPIRTRKNVYGAVSCGPWVEQGTEGMIVDGILRHVPESSRMRLDEASMSIEAYTPGRLQATQRLVNDLANDLAGIYEERFVGRRYLVEGSSIIRSLQEKSQGASPPSPESFAATLEEIFHEFERVTEFGRLVLYQWSPVGNKSRVLHLLSPSADGDEFPRIVRLLPAAHTRSSDDVRDELARQLSAFTGYDCLKPDRRGSYEFVLFCHERDRQLNNDLRNFFNQFATEVHYVLANLRNLAEAEARREELVLFTNRFKHAISSALQGVSDRVAQFQRYLRGNRTLLFSDLKNLVRDLDDFSTEADRVLERFTGLVRVTGQHGSLRPPYSFSTINMSNILDESVRRWSRAAEKRQIRVRGHESTRAVYQEGDLDALTEVFDNLVENALKFAKDGSTVTVQIIESEKRMMPTWTLDRPGRRFVVIDQGLGIAADELDRVFKPFVQGRAFSISRVIPGTGLGLAICQHIVTAHGGMITIRSRPAAAGHGGEPHLNPSRQFMRPPAPRHSHVTTPFPPPDDLQDCVVEVCVDLPLEVPRGGHTAP